MATYCVTFRIAAKTVAGKTYEDRRKRLIENVREKERGYWEETTSFLFVESYLNTGDFSRKACGGLSKSDDLVVVFDPEDMSACYFGPVAEAEVLESFLPKAQKLG